ncbi:GIY-YIG nuclease family protein [Flavobacterium sp. 7A]|uniref:GIY-YIG nuclease family protein n=1 Tax=Flavobacterium sp. 7A TaxID=2940571 RepID=UPI0022260382|nr:GIY-YIG nuclease family protein [Flavobacterium sp. 7A]MCW2119447.1 putative endonuclease [Flavobacterium sp. 7A]MCW2119448.1 putative endonuclease [Flavobacterium sp. 7A]
MKIYYVYILKCKDDSFYTGFTSNLDKRLIEHNAGIHSEAYTFTRRPITLVWFEMFTDPTQAISIEKKIKGWSRRKKQALIDQDWDKLVLYSKNYTQFGKNNEGFDKLSLTDE